MNPFANDESGEGKYLMIQGRSSREGSFELSDWRAPSKSSSEMADRETLGADGLITMQDRPTSREGELVEHERNISSVALLEPVLTREALVDPGLHPSGTHIKGGGSRPTSSRGSSSSSDSGLLYEDRIAKAETLDLLADEYPLPSIQGPQWYNRLRYHYLSMYVRLHIIVLLANIGTLIFIAVGSQANSPTYSYQDASTAFAVNMFVIFLTRNEHFINTLFHIFRSIPHSSPLWMRQHAAKVYTLGGIHSGCGVAALLWYTLFSFLLFDHEMGGRSPYSLAVRILSIIVFLFLAIIIAMAHPWIRVHHHDAWELSHRYLGWSVLLVVWTQIILLSLLESWSDTRSFGMMLITTPAFWLQTGVTCLLVYPWLRLKRQPLVAEQLSDHAIKLNLTNRRVPVGGAIRLAKNPLMEKHSFAVIPNADGSKGYSIIVSHAGDWTRSLIRPGEDGRPQKIWVSGVPYIGVYHVCLMFKPFVLVATGSGIAPCLSFLQIHPSWPVRVVWSARFPEVTYGKGIMEMVLNADPNAIIIDTKKTGRPDMPAIIYGVYKQFKAEAVVFVSNKPVTEEVVYALEARKVPTYGAIFDS